MMLPPEIRRKLSRLNADRRREGEAPAEPAQVPPGSGGPSPSQDWEIRNRLEELLPGRTHQHESGTLYIVERGLETLYPAGKEKLVSSMQEIRRLGCEPDEALFLDIETCGLANCPLFLVGIMSAREAIFGSSSSSLGTTRRSRASSHT